MTGPLDLRLYSSIFHSSARFGSADILRRYLDMADYGPIPLSLSHGVDVGQVEAPIDIQAPEPAHWAYNRDLAEAAERFKPAALVPHPVFLLGLMRERPRRKGVIVVGPPPGPDNDRRLLKALRREGIETATVLVKGRGPFEGSIDFWKSQGFDAVTLGTMDRFRYDDMAALFDRFETMICPTVSSAAFFMAALGGRVRFVRGSPYSAHEVVGYAANALQQFDTAVEPMRQLILASDEQRAADCRTLLGGDLALDPAAIRAEIERAIGRASGPVHVHYKYAWPLDEALVAAARMTGRPGLLWTPLAQRFRRRSKGVEAITLDEIDYWIDGPGEANFSAQPVPFVPGRTEPGFAVEQYSS